MRMVLIRLHIASELIVNGIQKPAILVELHLDNLVNTNYNLSYSSTSFNFKERS